MVLAALSTALSVPACSPDRAAREDSDLSSVDRRVYRAVACAASELPAHVGVWNPVQDPLFVLNGQPQDTLLHPPESCPDSGAASGIAVCGLKFIRPSGTQGILGEEARGGAVVATVSETGRCGDAASEADDGPRD